MSVLPRRRASAVTVGLLVAASLLALSRAQVPASADTGADCTATYTVAWQTPTDSPPDFGATVTVRNDSPYTINTWSVSLAFTGGQKLVPGSQYSAVVAQSGTTLTATPAGSYNGVLAPGASTTWGFKGTWNGTGNPAPTATCSGPTQGSSSATLSGPLEPLGVNTASWDTDFPAAGLTSSLAAAKVGLIRYPGGSWADEYLWQSNTAKGQTMPVDFAQYSRAVNAAGGQKFVTVNYGSDTPASAAAWVEESKKSGQGVTLWELGNELYGSWEHDDHSGAHTAASYASKGRAYLQAIKTADPKAQTCYDYGMDGELAPGSGVEGWQAWNSTILDADADLIDCADVHWYPINGVPPQTTQSIMQLVDNIPAAAAQVKATLAAHDPTAYFVVGETNMSQTANEWNEKPVGALFAAANALEWLANGAQSVDWWDVHNYGDPAADFGMFSSGTNGQPAVNTPFPPYYGHLLASKLAVKGATVGTLVVATPDVYGYWSKLPDGTYAVMLVNANPSKAYSLATSALGVTGSGQTRSVYSAANPTVTGAAFSGTSVALPAESVVVLSGGTGAPPSTAPATTTSPVTTTTSPVTTSPVTTSPVTTTPVTTTAVTTTAAGAATCTASLAVSSSWPGGFVAGVTVTAGAAPVKGWTVALGLPSGAAITSAWNGVATGTTGTVRVAAAAYNGSLPPGGSTSFGFQGTGSPTGTTATCTAT